MNTHLTTMVSEQYTSQVNAFQQPSSWCEIYNESDHSSEICGANPNSVNFVGNAH